MMKNINLTAVIVWIIIGGITLFFMYKSYKLAKYFNEIIISYIHF